MSVFVAEFGGLTFTNQWQPWNDVRFRLTNLAGWYDSPPIRTRVTDRPNTDFAYTPGRSLRGSKSLQIEGIVEARSAELAVASGFRMLAGISPRGWDEWLAATDPMGRLEMVTRLNGVVACVPFHERRAKFSVPLVSHDPRKLEDAYQWTVRTSGVSGGGLKYPLFGGVGSLGNGRLDWGNLVRQGGFFTIRNTGTAPMYPVFRVDGGAMEGGFEIVDTETGEAYRYEADVELGEVIEIDAKNNRVLSNGQNDYSVNLTTRDDMTVLENSERTFRFRALGSTTGDPILTITTRNAWY